MIESDWDDRDRSDEEIEKRGVLEYLSRAISYLFNPIGDAVVRNIGGLEQSDLED